MTSSKTSSTSSSRRTRWTALGAGLAVFGVANLWSGLPSWSPVDHEPLDDARFRLQIEETAPELVLLGNSMLGEGIDAEELERRVGRPTLKITSGGAASAWWWVVFKNSVATADPAPESVVVFFRDGYLTDPGFRTRAGYQTHIDRYSTPTEPLLDELAYARAMGGTELWMRRALPAYRSREETQRTLSGWAKQRVAGWLPEPQDGIEGALDRVFAEERMLPELVTQRQLAAEADVPDPPSFDEAFPGSFLGPMLDLAEERGIALHFVRVKRRAMLAEQQSPELLAYVTALRTYLDGRGSVLLDYSEDARIRLEHFGRGDHLNRQAGRSLFTGLVAEDLTPVLSEPAS